MRSRNEQLEADKLSKLPPDAAAEVKALQDKLVYIYNCYYFAEFI